jgi:hypothetical protein
MMRAQAEDALQRITARGISLIAVCPALDEPHLAPLPAGSLYALIVSGQTPSWLHELPVQSHAVRLFQVVKS